MKGNLSCTILRTNPKKSTELSQDRKLNKFRKSKEEQFHFIRSTTQKNMRYRLIQSRVSFNSGVASVRLRKLKSETRSWLKMLRKTETSQIKA